MDNVQRKKSPRAPSMPLDEAIERVNRVYEKERRHPAPIDLIAQHMGYKSANSGTALSALASARYFGLLERAGDGKVAVAKEVESYIFAPSPEMRGDFLKRWLKTPPVFAELLEKYRGGLPSDANLRYDLIQRGFLPIGAEAAIPIFRKSVDFARYFESQQDDEHPGAEGGEHANIDTKIQPTSSPNASLQVAIPPNSEPMTGESNLDRIPVRLSGGRRAWLMIPEPFFEADKKRLKDQIDLLLAEDE